MVIGGASAMLGARYLILHSGYGYMTGSAYWELDLLMVQVYTIAVEGENRQSI
jgi:hypothetical protein